MLEWLRNLLSSNKKKKIKEIASRIERFMQRYKQANDTIKYNLSHRYHTLILNSNTVEEAEHYENEFYKKIEEQGSDLTNYKESKKYADDSYTHSEIYETSINPSSNIEDISAVYYSTQHSNENTETTEGQGEFGGGGASESWEETGSDNS